MTYKKNGNGQFAKTHGLSKHPLYRIWRNILRRCYNSANKGYKNYGGRGIELSCRWFKFERFMEDMYGSYLDHLKENDSTSINRIDNNGDYKISNCEWATNKEQSNNKRKQVVKKTIKRKRVIGVSPEMKNRMTVIKIPKIHCPFKCDSWNTV